VRVKRGGRHIIRPHSAVPQVAENHTLRPTATRPKHYDQEDMCEIMADKKDDNIGLFLREIVLTGLGDGVDDYCTGDIQDV
jgi:hypothetical protein